LSITNQGLPLLNIVLISAGSLLVVAAVLMYCFCWKCRKTVVIHEIYKYDSTLPKLEPRTP
ncbi:hypothetical protein QQF64_019526, partial [Cirrhinus molitorella]